MPAINLADLHFFAQLPDSARDRIKAMAEEVTAEAGAVIIEQGDVGREAFVIQSGEAAVFVNGDRVATIGPQSLIGEMALIDRRPRSATVRALTDMALMSFSAERFHAILDEIPEDKVRLLERHAAAQRAENLRDRS